MIVRRALFRLDAYIVSGHTASLLCIASGFSSFAFTQDAALDARSMGEPYARLVSFEAEPEIAAARFSVNSDSPESDRLAIRTAKLPYYQEFSTGNERLGWFVQATANYMDVSETLRLEIGPGLSERLDASWEGFGAIFEAGLLIPVTENVTLVPSFGAGLSRLESKMKFATPFVEELFAPTLNGVLYNWDTLASVSRASVSLRYHRRLGSWRIKGSGHVSGTYVDSFNESDRFEGFSDTAGNLTLKLDISHPSGLSISDYPLLFIGHLGYTDLIGADIDDIGFKRFGEAGLSLGVGKFTLGLLGILGGDVSGWNLQFNYDY